MHMPEAGLLWPIRRSFARYIATLSDGRLALSDGIELAQDDCLFFPSLAAQSLRGELAFKGVAHFSGHVGLLSVRIARPRLLVHPDARTGTLWVNDSVLATFAYRHVAARDRAAIEGCNVRLAPQGVALFGGHYSEGDALDDFTVLLASEELT
jgi:hypothetical protein